MISPHCSDEEVKESAMLVEHTAKRAEILAHPASLGGVSEPSNLNKMMTEQHKLVHKAKIIVNLPQHSED
jgi:hypothetical protein